MTAKAFEEWFSKECPPGTIISDPSWWAPRIERQVRAALLADRPEVMEIVDLVDDIVTAARLTQFYEDPIHKPWCEQVWRSVDTARRTIATRRKRLESLAAQLAQRDERFQKVADHIRVGNGLHNDADWVIVNIPRDLAKSIISDFPVTP